uniref:Uncharacterized protein n=1 Tax=Arundo donax TaxID=35708 RepID=A0A0A9E3A6_ARUDO
MVAERKMRMTRSGHISLWRTGEIGFPNE